MEVSVEVHKIIKYGMSSPVFFPSDGGVDDVFLRLSLIKQTTKDIYLMCIYSVSNTDRYLGIVNESVQYVQDYFQYVCIPI